MTCARHTSLERRVLQRGVGSSALLLLLRSCSAEPPVPWAHSPEGRVARWGTSNLTLTVAPPPSGTLLRWSEIHAGAQFALEQWGVASHVTLVGGRHEKLSEDGVNTLVVATRREAERAEVARFAHGETKLYLRSVDGESHAEIVEADIVLRLSAIDWSGPGRTEQLRALLIHEIGHFLGLGHACTLGVSEMRSPVTCSSEPSLLERAMYPDALAPRPAGSVRPSDVELAAVRERFGLN